MAATIAVCVPKYNRRSTNATRTLARIAAVKRAWCVSSLPLQFNIITPLAMHGPGGVERLQNSNEHSYSPSAWGYYRDCRIQCRATLCRIDTQTNTMTEAAHAKFAPSASPRWIPCNASVNFSEDRTDEPNDAAQWGTEVHHWFSMPFRDNGELSHPPYNWPVDKANDAITCLAEWEKHVPMRTAQREVKLFSKSFPDLLFGTIDALWFDPADCINIADLKTGLRGVNATDNDQLLCYSFIASENFPTVKTFRTLIVQPRRNYAEPCTYTLAQVQAYGERVKSAITSPPTFVAGTHCEFCPYRAHCSTLHNSLFDLLREAGELDLWKADLAGKTTLTY